jgi:predicted ATP-grasp superfamily ATP-dependent carboligase
MNTADAAFVLTHESNPRRKTRSMNMIALAITRSLGRRGVRVVRVHPNRLDRSLLSRYCSTVEISPDFYESEAALLEFLLAMRARYFGKAVLIPASDDCAYFVSRHHEALSRVFEVVSPAAAVMKEILDKRHQYEHAQRLGIPIPETYFPAGVEEVRELAAGLAHYPYVIKPLVAHSWRLASMQEVSGGKKGFPVANPQALIERYEAIAAGDKNVMIQEVIGGKDERLFTFLSYFDAQAQPLAYCVRKKIRQFPVDFGYCTMTESCFDKVVEAQSIRLLQGLGYHGISGVEWKLDPRTGVYKLIEINARAVNTIALAAACGVDIPYLAFHDKAIGRLAPVTEWQEGVKWANIEQDVWAARTLHRMGKLGFFEWLGSLADTRVHAIFAADDIRPFIGSFTEFVRHGLASLLGHHWRRRPAARAAAQTSLEAVSAPSADPLQQALGGVVRSTRQMD